MWIKTFRMLWNNILPLTTGLLFCFVFVFLSHFFLLTEIKAIPLPIVFVVLRLAWNYGSMHDSELIPYPPPSPSAGITGVCLYLILKHTLMLPRVLHVYSRLNNVLLLSWSYTSLIKHLQEPMSSVPSSTENIFALFGYHTSLSRFAHITTPVFC